MADIAKKKLLTSKGVVRSGEELPDSLPAKEVDAIRAAGGIEEQRTATRKSGKPAKKVDKPTAAEIAAAEQAVADAEADVSAAGEDLAKKAEAQKTLEAAQANLAKLKD